MYMPKINKKWEYYFAFHVINQKVFRASCSVTKYNYMILECGSINVILVFTR